MPTVTASDSVKLYVEAHGEGFPLLLSPGYCQTHENFRPQVEPFVGAGARVVLWDYRGHGKSEAPEDEDAYFLEQVLDDMDRVLEWAAPGAARGVGRAFLRRPRVAPFRGRPSRAGSGPAALRQRSGFQEARGPGELGGPGRPHRRPSREDGLRGLRRRPRLDDRHRTSAGSPGGPGGGPRHPGAGSQRRSALRPPHRRAGPGGDRRSGRASRCRRWSWWGSRTPPTSGPER